MVPSQMCASCDDNESCRPELPGCEIDTCGLPDYLNDTILIGNIFEVNARLKYACATGYSNTGSSYTTCENNGKWTSNDTCVLDVNHCPFSTDYQNGILSDGNKFKYWLVQAEYSQSEAAALCLECHGRLVEIISPPKLTFLQNILTYKGNEFDYWIDGSSGEAVDVSSSDAWTTTSGATIPLSDELWVPNTPDYINVEKCVRLRSVKNYFFDNRMCSHLFRAICEYIN